MKPFIASVVVITTTDNEMTTKSVSDDDKDNKIAQLERQLAELKQLVLSQQIKPQPDRLNAEFKRQDGVFLQTFETEPQVFYNTVNDWVLRVGDGQHFWSSNRYYIWGVDSENKCVKHFIKNTKKGDRLWFIQGNGNQGKILAVANFKENKPRVLGPLIEITRNDNELGWNTEKKGSWDTEVHYTDIYHLNQADIRLDILGQATIRRFTKDKFEEGKYAFDLCNIYDKIIRGNYNVTIEC